MCIYTYTHTYIYIYIYIYIKNECLYFFLKFWRLCPCSAWPASARHGSAAERLIAANRPKAGLVGPGAGWAL